MADDKENKEAAAAKEQAPQVQKEEAKPTGPEPAPLKGLVGTKVGMTRIFVDEFNMVPVSVISAAGNQVTEIRTPETNGYKAVQVGYEDIKEKKLTKAELGHLKKKGIAPKKNLLEFRVNDISPFQVGQSVPVSVFAKGDNVNVSGISKGKGFAGGMKRHGFHGGPHSHGHGEYRRASGSSGAQGPQHVLPGTKKPGHMGNVWTTVQNVQVVEVDTEKNLILIEGSIPGPNGNLVVIKPSSRPKKVVKAQTGGKKKGKR